MLTTKKNPVYTAVHLGQNINNKNLDDALTQKMMKMRIKMNNK